VRNGRKDSVVDAPFFQHPNDRLQKGGRAFRMQVQANELKHLENWRWVIRLKCIVKLTKKWVEARLSDDRENHRPLCKNSGRDRQKGRAMARQGNATACKTVTAVKAAISHNVGTDQIGLEKETEEKKWPRVISNLDTTPWDQVLNSSHQSSFSSLYKNLKS
jgi:hypothetical protein